MELNEVTSDSIGLLVKERPAPPAPEPDYDAIKLPGRDGTLYRRKDIVPDIPVKITFGFKAKKDLWMEQYRIIKEWLYDGIGGRLVLSDDPEYFYQVKHLKIKSTDRFIRTMGQIVVEFICSGYQYLLEGTTEMDIDQVLYNRYFLSHPVYKITGEGVCTLTVNGKTMVANVGQNLTIDTERKLSYRLDNTIMNTSVTGDYDDMYLLRGKNSITITNGFELKIIPNWRCR